MLEKLKEGKTERITMLEIKFVFCFVFFYTLCRYLRIIRWAGDQYKHNRWKQDYKKKKKKKKKKNEEKF